MFGFFPQFFTRPRHGARFTKEKSRNFDREGFPFAPARFLGSRREKKYKWNCCGVSRERDGESQKKKKKNEFRRRTGSNWGGVYRIKITRHDDIIVSYCYHKTTYTCFVKRRAEWVGESPPFIIDLSLLRQTMLFFVSLSRLFLTCGWHAMDTSNQDRLISVWSSLWSLLMKFVNTRHQVTAQPYYKKWQSAVLFANVRLSNCVKSTLIKWKKN